MGMRMRNKKSMALLLSFSLITASFSALSGNAGTQVKRAAADGSGFAAGDGTVDAPYQIADKDDLIRVGTLIKKDDQDGQDPANDAGTPYKNCYYQLTADITLDAPWVPVTEFAGTFDGNGKSISGIKITVTEPGAGSGTAGISYLGLFQKLDGATVKNLSIKDSQIQVSSGTFTPDAIGLLAGEAVGASIEGVTVAKEESTSSRIQVDGSIVVSGGIGGLAGKTINTSFKDCTNTAELDCSASKNIGGIAGSVTDGQNIRNCRNSGKIAGQQNVGGIAGEVKKTENASGTLQIENGINTGDIEGDNNIGGIIGISEADVISTCRNTGPVSGKSGVGGIAGEAAGTLAGVMNSGDIKAEGASGGDTPDVGGIAGRAAGGKEIEIIHAGNTGKVSTDISVKSFEDDTDADHTANPYAGGILGHESTDTENNVANRIINSYTAKKTGDVETATEKNSFTTSKNVSLEHSFYVVDDEQAAENSSDTAGASNSADGSATFVTDKELKSGKIGYQLAHYTSGSAGQSDIQNPWKETLSEEAPQTNDYPDSAGEGKQIISIQFKDGNSSRGSSTGNAIEYDTIYGNPGIRLDAGKMLPELEDGKYYYLYNKKDRQWMGYLAEIRNDVTLYVYISSGTSPQGGWTYPADGDDDDGDDVTVTPSPSATAAPTAEPTAEPAAEPTATPEITAVPTASAPVPRTPVSVATSAPNTSSDTGSSPTPSASPAVGSTATPAVSSDAGSSPAPSASPASSAAPASAAPSATGQPAASDSDLASGTSDTPDTAGNSAAPESAEDNASEAPVQDLKDKTTPLETGEEVKSDNAVFKSDGKNSVVMEKNTDPNIKKAEIPDTITVAGVEYKVTTLSDGAYAGCKNLKTVSLGKNVKKIGKGAFKNCTNLKTVSFPSNLKTVSQGAFKNCVKLKSAALPKTIKTVGKACFKNCKSMKTFAIGNVKKTKSGGLMLTDDKDVMYGGTPVTISIAASALENCVSLKQVIINSQVRKIGDAAFRQCKKLSAIIVYSLILKKVGKKALVGVHNCKISVPTKKVKPYKVLFNNKGQGKKVVVARM